VHAPQPGAGTLRDQLRIVATAHDFRWLLTCFVIQALATGCILAGVDYLASDVLGRDGATTILFICFVGPALVLTPAWSAIGTRIGKKRGYVYSSIFLAVGALLLSTAQAAPAAAVYLATALVGVGYAGCQVFPMAMLPDAAAVDARRTGSNRAGVYTGVWTAAETLGLALGPAVYALVLAIGGYRSSTDNDDVVQSDTALTAITLGISVLPAALIIVSLLWLRRYSLDARTVDESVSA
jgi:Na+/melibiose symporter-like transporter